MSVTGSAPSRLEDISNSVMLVLDLLSIAITVHRWLKAQRRHVHAATLEASDIQDLEAAMEADRGRIPKEEGCVGPV